MQKRRIRVDVTVSALGQYEADDKLLSALSGPGFERAVIQCNDEDDYEASGVEKRSEGRASAQNS